MLCNGRGLCHNLISVSGRGRGGVGWSIWIPGWEYFLLSGALLMRGFARDGAASV